jgi:hypothetical protein
MSSGLFGFVRTPSDVHLRPDWFGLPDAHRRTADVVHEIARRYVAKMRSPGRVGSSAGAWAAQAAAPRARPSPNELQSVEETATQGFLVVVTKQVPPSFFRQKSIALRHSWLWS